MPLTSFYAATDGANATTPGYTAGSGSLALATGAGPGFGSPTPTAPILVSTFLADGTPRGRYRASGRSGDTLTGLALVGGTDVGLPAGSIVADVMTAEHLAQTNGAVAAIEAATTQATPAAGTVYADSGGGAPTFRALAAADVPGLDGSKIVGGTVADARLGGNVAFKGAANLFSAAQTFNHHVASTGPVPSILAGVAPGSAPTIAIAGTDTAGTIGVTTTASPVGSATVATVTFGVPFGAAPNAVLLAPANAAAAALSGAGAVRADSDNLSTSGFALSVGPTALAAGTTYKWYYLVMG